MAKNAALSRLGKGKKKAAASKKTAAKKTPESKKKSKIRVVKPPEAEDEEEEGEDAEEEIEIEESEEEESEEEESEEEESEEDDESEDDDDDDSDDEEGDDEADEDDESEVVDEATQGKKKKSKKKWHMTGNEAKAQAERDAATNKRQPLRFRLREDESAEVVWMDDEGFAFYEHELQIGGRWGNYYTCRRGLDSKGCPLCAHFGRTHRVLTTMRSIVDTRPFESKREKKIIPWTRKIHASKDRTNKTIERKKKTKGTLVGWKFLVTRTDAKTARCGDDYDAIEKVNLKKFKYKDKKLKKTVYAEPFDYEETFEPLPYAALKDLILEVDSGRDDEDGDGDQEIPF